jgi:fatty-acyl-CoA synthase
MKSTMMTVPLSTNHLLERAGKYFADHEIVSRLPDKSIRRSTFGELFVRARQLSKALAGAGVDRGEAVGTLMWNHSAHLECYFGIPAAGAVLHTLNLRLSAADIAYIVEDAGDRLVIVDDILLPLWDNVAALLKSPPRAIVYPFSGKPVSPGWETYEDFIAADARDYVYPQHGENEPMGMCYTSGTTGRPKGVVYSHRSMVLHCITECMPDLIGLSAHDRVLVVTPMFHANAWAMPFAATIVGASLILPGPHLGAEDLLDVMEAERITLALGVPTIWMTILQALETPARKRTLVKGMRMLVGGSAVPQAMIAGFAGHNMHIRHGWGMTETSPLASLSWLKPGHLNQPLADQHAILARQGMPAPLVEMRIRDDEGRVQPWDGCSIGEVQVRGPWVTGSYHNASPSQASFTEDGWLRTGDVGMIDPDGSLRLSDRKKDLIKSGGEWISSVDLENAVMAHPAIAEAAVVAIRHPKWDERPLVVAVRKSGRDVTPEELRAFLMPKFAKWQVPDDFVFVEALPRTSTGKFMKSKLREDFKNWVSQTPA